MKIDENGVVIRRILVFKFLFLEHWIEINERWDVQSVGANIIGESKKATVRANVRSKKTTEIFSNGFLLLNTQFNNGFKYRTVVKDSV
jgi:hypothetical protein